MDNNKKTPQLSLKQKLQWHDGMSLVEVLMMITVLSLVGLGTGTMVKNLFSIQRQNVVKYSLYQFKEEMEMHLRDPVAWGNTINAAENTATLACLRDAAAGCPNNGDPNNTTSAQNFSIRNSANNIVYAGHVATQGLQADGNNCNSYGANPDCPFRYETRVTFYCPNGAANCVKPEVRIEMQLLIDAGAANGELAYKFNPERYSIEFFRSQRSRGEPFIIQQFETGSAGGGNCNGGSGIYTTFTPGRTVDPYNIVTLQAGNTEFVLQPGEYECHVSGQAFHQIGGFQMELVNRVTNRVHLVGQGFSYGQYKNPVPPVPGPTPAPPGSMPCSNKGWPYSHYGTTTQDFWSTSHVSGYVKLDITRATRFSLRKDCKTAAIAPNGPRNHPNPNSCHFRTPPATNAAFNGGLPVGGYGQGNLYASVACIRTN